jgi:hypothetical protein
MKSCTQHRRIITVQIQVRHSVYFSTAAIDNITIPGTVVTSECFVAPYGRLNTALHFMKSNSFEEEGVPGRPYVSWPP